jgi:SAM-dependent methyltransferase
VSEVQSILSDASHVREQYRDSSKLDARVRIYDLYAQRPESFQTWVFDRMQLRSGDRVLDVGAGTANLWRENAARAAGLSLLLGDRSPGMLRTAGDRLARTGLACRRAQLDAQALPFADASFGVVVANHMLYHVPDRARALSEIRRVLVPGGRFYSTTNGWSHLLEMRELVRRFGLASAMRSAVSASGAWDLEEAAREFGARFEDVRLESCRDVLRVTDAGPLVDAIRSIGSTSGDAPPDERVLREIHDHVEWMIRLEGGFHVSTWAGLVSGRRP